MEELERAKNFIRERVPKNSDLFVFFNNDFNGYAIKNAKEMAEILS